MRVGLQSDQSACASSRHPRGPSSIAAYSFKRYQGTGLDSRN